MVFESVVVEVLNRFLSDYVENLDSKQLKIGIWGGDVVLNNLILKQTALNDLDLPIQTVYGRLNSLVLKIPWKNIYTAAVVAEINGLYLLVEPNNQIKYNAEKEERQELEAKNAELQKVENIKKRKEEADKEPVDDTFVEKLTTQIIKNVQIKISNIHIRYEDKITNLGHPFAMGISLSNLSMQTTSENWVPKLATDAMTQFYKIMELEGLAVYWNCDASQYADISKEDRLVLFQNEIATKEDIPIHFQYILGPINSTAKLIVNPKPHLDKPAFSVAKLQAELTMVKLAVSISKCQYRDLILFADSMDTLNRGLPFRKYRPNVEGYKGHAKEWWQFAYICVLESEVRRVRRNWEWRHIINHKNLCREYCEAYKTKLTVKKLPVVTKEALESLERRLDVFNIVLLRQRIEMEVERLGILQKEAAKEKRGKTWLGGWWGGNITDTAKDLNTTTDIMRQFQDAMTADEKERLFKAIDYNQSAGPTIYPDEFVDSTFTFNLHNLVVDVNDDSAGMINVVSAELLGVKCQVQKREAMQALTVNVNIRNLNIYGLEGDEFVPLIVTSIQADEQGSDLLNVLFETNPLDRTCDHRLHLKSKPLKVIYDALTINNVVNVFKPAQASEILVLEQLSTATANGLSNIREMSASGLENIINQHPRLDLQLELNAPYVLLPYGGRYTEVENVLLVNFGKLQMTSVPRGSEISLRDLVKRDRDNAVVFQELVDNSYDRFKLGFTGLQVLLAQGGEDWMKVMLTNEPSSMHLLHPTEVQLQFSRCLVTDDPRLARMKLTGTLPSLSLYMTDSKLLTLLALANSITLPDDADAPLLGQLSKVSVGSMATLRYMELERVTNIVINKQKPVDMVEFTEIEINLVMEEMKLRLSRQETLEDKPKDTLLFSIHSLECDFRQQTYNKLVNLRLGNVTLDQHCGDKIIRVIDSPITEGEYLTKVNFLQADKKSPEFLTVYNNCECMLGLEFTSLSVLLNQIALTDILVIVNNIKTQIDEMNQVKVPRRRTLSIVSLSKRRSSVVSNLSTLVPALSTVGKKKMKKQNHKLIIFHLVADLQQFSVTIENPTYKIATISVAGISANLVQTSRKTLIVAKLLDFHIDNLNPNTVHKMIICVMDKEVINAKIIMYNDNAEMDVQKVNMSVEATVGNLRIVVLYRFISNVMNFLENFQVAQAAIQAAAADAAETAKQNVQQAYENATRIALNINLKAPTFCIPEATHSLNALIIDCGYLRITNIFKELDIRNEHNVCAVMDDLTMDLTDFKIMRVLLDSTAMNIEQHVDILEPLSFQFMCKRNLSTAWYIAPPNIDVSAIINNIIVHLSQPDYNMVMNMVEQNLSDSVPNNFAAPPQLPSELFRHAKVDSRISYTNMTTPPSTTSPSKEQNSVKEADDVHCFIKWSFHMENFVINLFNSPLRSSAQQFNTARIGLGRFSLSGLSLTGRLLTDDTLNASVLLINCLIDDIRPNNVGNHLNRLFERKPESEEYYDGAANISTHQLKQIQNIKHTVQVNVHRSHKDMTVDLKVYSVTTIVAMDFVSKISEFFKSAEPKSELEKPKTSSLHNIKNVANSNSVMQRESIITITIMVEKPDIILVENMNDIDTYALLLNTEILVKLRLSGKHQVINGTISDTNLAICCFNPEKRERTKAAVLYPVTISASGSTPADKGLHIDVVFSDVKISVSPTTIEIANKIMAAFASTATELEKSLVESLNLSNMWEMTPYQDKDYWFLKEEHFEVGQDAVKELERPVIEDTPLTELCMLSIPSFIVTVEAGVGTKTIPMILMQSSLAAKVNNWSSQMAIEAELSLQMGYYNSYLALWEPLIEPININNGLSSSYVPWTMTFELVMAPTSVNNSHTSLSNLTQCTSASTDGEISEQIRSAAITIDLSSQHSLEMTVTKSALEVLSNLSKAFTNAMTIAEEPTVHPMDARAPFRMVNYTGMEVNILLSEGAFDLYENRGHQEVVLENLAEVNLQEKVKKTKHKINLELLLHTTIDQSDSYIHVQIKNSVLKLPVIRADVRYFPIKYKGDSNDNWGLISSVLVENGITTVTLCSIILVHNHFDVPIDVYYMTARGNELAMVATVKPNDKLYLPLVAVYTPTNEIFLSVNGYSVTTTPFVWKDLQLNLAVTKMLSCAPIDVNSEEFPFMIKVVGELQQVYHENTLKHTMLSTLYHIHLRPALVLKNCLPVQVIICLQDLDKQETVEAGASIQLPNVEPGKSYIIIRLPNYLEKEWSCRRDILTHTQQFTVWTFDSHDSVVKMSLDLGMQNFNKGGSSVMSLYCPFWMLNKTGLLLSYRKSKKTEKNEAAGTTSKADENLNIIHHPHIHNGPILFSFNAKNFFGKKKASIRIEQGEWSDKFSLDVAGSSGVVTCKSNNIIYQVGVSNKLTYNGLTKQVTFTPYYVLINNAHFAIEVQELARPADAWTAVESISCTPLWTCSENDDKLLIARVVGSDDVSAPFLITESHTTLLKLKNKFGGINVDIQLTEGAVYINMTSYERGMAPVLILNNTQHTMNLWEKESVQLRKLDPMHSLLYTWENPSGARVIMWEGGFKSELEDDVRKDDVGDYMISETEKVFWVSFLDGMQRILLFTTNDVVAENAQSAKKFEIVEQEITLNLYGMGISLIHNAVGKEIMYMAIASTGIIWEQCKLNSKRFKPMTEKENIQMEGAYQQFMNRYALSTVRIANCIVDGKTEVDFLEGLMIKPHKRKIRRTFQNGLWVQMKTSPHQMQLHAKVNRVQIDNQLYDCIFPVVLAPVPPPKSVGESGVHKPFVELSIVELLMKHSQIKQYKYFKVLIQEFHIKVDLGFINALIEVFNTADSTVEEDKESFHADIAFAEAPLYSHVSTQYMQDQKNFYDLLHFSPLKIHISFSLAAGSSTTSANAHTPNIVNVLLQGLGVTLTDLQDVVFKLGYFEREYSFLSQKQLTSETQSHYVGQLVKQLYVLVFGLDVIGNPYGLVIGISKGVEDLFYEPFQGAIQGPGEFAEGLVLGVRSLFGHTVGGAAGAVSRITGAMGKGIAALTFDKDYQRKRRDQINKKPETVQEGIARSGKGLVMGVVDGVTGVFTKPVSGAKEEGIEGFFKGVGKGAIGLLTRPTAGVVDFASSSFDTVKRVTEVGNEETIRLRPPRFIPPDGLIRPYNFKESEGQKLLNEVEKGKYSSTDVYSYHVIITVRKEVFLLTDKRMGYITYSELFGGWQMAWSYTWSDLKTPPKIVAKGILISTEGSKKKKMGFFGSSDLGKTLLIADQQLCAEVCARIEELQQKA